MKIYLVECESIRVCDGFLKWKWFEHLALEPCANLPQRVWRGPPLAMDSENSAYEKLVAQCKSNGELTSCLSSSVAFNRAIDVDVKVDALTKLQALFEKGGLEVRRVLNILSRTVLILKS
jgi:hypothetical protein